MSPVICVSIGNIRFEQVMKVLQHSDMAEIRIDLLDLTDDQLKDVFSSHGNLIATCRPGKHSEEMRLELLQEALRTGATMVDIELETDETIRKPLMELARRLNRKVLFSWHNDQETPSLEKLRTIIQSMFDAGADLVKIACLIQSDEDSARILGLYADFDNLIAIGMGEKGVITRLAAPLLGASFTYAGLDQHETAQGQLSKERMEDFYKFLL